MNFSASTRCALIAYVSLGQCPEARWKAGRSETELSDGAV